MISFCNLAVIVFKDMDSNSILHVVFYIHVTSSGYIGICIKNEVSCGFGHIY